MKLVGFLFYCLVLRFVTSFRERSLTSLLISSCNRFPFGLYGNLRECQKLKRSHSPRRALLRALTTQVLRHGRIITTLNKAKQTKPRVERIIKYAKHPNTRHARILINKWLYDRELAENVLKLAPIRFKERHGGYCRIKRLSYSTVGDNSKRAILELLDY
ncbi:putative 50S ribosomal subunit protein L17 [Babesia bovis T2Bo]|uniref:50S ribosomal subunit protein L17, putative n=1 Tax=Babesia bovis TaxID=5865 RepID=A7AN22_BABBO|nr:putative 50S ribosomal subunit protein L17 [Babesia bovis T2Bo]EDO07956.1 putative 50S ribosomal subunit protein L17 [Babesia bovis T2Bo]BAN64806.1 50S ribosomal subunit protein L17, putative [Babesia bovis]|eukprot:XP_001611524.1 50S ribosomal subunit protein L17 [Babesia bovis T2Bo]